MKRILRLAALSAAIVTAAAVGLLAPTSQNSASAFQVVRVYRGGYYDGGYRQYNGYSGYGYGPYGHGTYEYIPPAANEYPYRRRTIYGGLFPGYRGRLRYEQVYTPFGNGFYTPYGY